MLRNFLLLSVALALCVPTTRAQTGATTRILHTDPSVTYSGSWYINDSSAHLNGSSALTNARGAQAVVTFTGTGITWIGLSDPWCGVAWVYLDGTLNTIDTYASDTHYQQPLFSVSGLAPGPHTLSIEIPHVRGASTNGSWVWINAFDIENGSGLTGGIEATEGRTEQNTPALNYTGTWLPHANAQHSGGSALLAVDAGSRASITFNGTGISWIAYRDQYSGIARVYLDGELRSLVDTYLLPAQGQAPAYAINNLPPGVHSLTIEVTGTRNALSEGSWVWIDAFDVPGDGPASVIDGGVPLPSDGSANPRGRGFYRW